MCEAMRGVETVTSTTTAERVGTVSESDRRQFREAVRRYDGSGRSEGTTGQF
jgi:hypothetical protein